MFELHLSIWRAITHSFCRSLSFSCSLLLFPYQTLQSLSLSLLSLFLSLFYSLSLCQPLQSVSQSLFLSLSLSFTLPIYQSIYLTDTYTHIHTHYHLPRTNIHQRNTRNTSVSDISRQHRRQARQSPPPITKSPIVMFTSPTHLRFFDSRLASPHVNQLPPSRLLSPGEIFRVTRRGKGLEAA